jgi:hypothetical protein
MERKHVTVIPTMDNVMELSNFLSSLAWEFGRGKEEAIINEEGPFGYGLYFRYRGDQYQLTIAQCLDEGSIGYGEGGYGDDPEEDSEENNAGQKVDTSDPLP